LEVSISVGKPTLAGRKKEIPLLNEKYGALFGDILLWHISGILMARSRKPKKNILGLISAINCC
jgi:hypothetical protein